MITPDSIREPQTLQYVLEAHEHQLQGLEDDPTAQNLPEDLEMIVMEANYETARIQLLSRGRGMAFVWTEERGML